MSENTDKISLRRHMAVTIATMSAEERADADRRIPERFRQWLSCVVGKPEPGFWEGLTLLAFMPLPDEPEITPLLIQCMENNGTLVLPRLGAGNELVLCRIGNLERDLQPGAYGILEPHRDLPPFDMMSVDVALIPGRAFSEGGERLGRGLGCYDRLLCAMTAKRVALAYDCQILPAIPVAEHDRQVHVIVTPTRIMECRA